MYAFAAADLLTGGWDPWYVARLTGQRKDEVAGLAPNEFADRQ